MKHEAYGLDLPLQAPIQRVSVYHGGVLRIALSLLSMLILFFFLKKKGKNKREANSPKGVSVTQLLRQAHLGREPSSAQAQALRLEMAS